MKYIGINEMFRYKYIKNLLVKVNFIRLFFLCQD